jgi:hypothetical protein
MLVPAFALFAGYLALGAFLPITWFPDSGKYVDLVGRGASTILGAFASFEAHASVRALFALLRRAEAIAVFQAALSFAAWATLAYAVARPLRGWLRYLTLALILSGAVAADVLVWTRAILSESVSVSLFALLAGLFALLVYEHGRMTWGRTLAYAGGFAVSALLFAQAREAHPYMLAAAAAPLLLAFALKRDRRIRAGLVAGICAIGAGLMAHTLKMDRGPTHVPNLGNVIGKRILPDPEFAAWFAERGLPDGAMTECLRGRFFFDCASIDDERFRDWIIADGARVYAAFLLAHPGYALPRLLDPMSMRQNLFPWYWQGDPCAQPCKDAPDPAYIAAASLNPWAPYPARLRLASLVLLAIGAVMAVRLARRTGRRNLLSANLPAAFFLSFGIGGTFVCYHGDAMEVARHCIVPALAVRLGLLCAVVHSLGLMLAGDRADRAEGPVEYRAVRPVGGPAAYARRR